MKDSINRYYELWFGINEIYERWAKSHGMTLNELFALYFIDKETNCTPQLISRRLMLPKQTVTSLLKNLEARNIITKTSSETDRRSVRLGFTGQGKKHARSLLRDMEAAEAKAFADMGQEDLEGYLNGGLSLFESLNKYLK